MLGCNRLIGIVQGARVVMKESLEILINFDYFTIFLTMM
jgi:hypothetical protein